ncbi:MAG: type 1 glutamine amidotransferase [Actinobacteria bacterium]|nr:MAG: type 1 glutamine amidotransferase [Actinomycetota bacterium]
MTNDLQGKRIAILTANEGVEQVEYTEPRKALEDAGAAVELIAPEKGDVQMFDHLDKADVFQADKAVSDVRADDYDALMLPGGVANPDHLRMDADAVRFVQAFVNAGKPIAAICHAPWMLVEADAVRGRTLTSYPSEKTDIRNAGGTWVDEEVHVDQGLVTSRKPDDLPAFNAKMIEEFAEGKHEVREKAGAGAATS